MKNKTINHTSDHSPCFHLGHSDNSTHFLWVITLVPGHNFSSTISIPFGVSFSQCTLLTCVPSSQLRLHGDHDPINHLQEIEKVFKIEISPWAKRKFKCWLTELKCWREDLVVQEDLDYYCCLNNLSFTVNYNLSLENNEVFCWIVHHNLFQYIEIIPPHISSWQSGIISKQPLIQQVAHAAFDPLGVRQHFPCDSNF
jgi:hypothetical protein